MEKKFRNNGIHGLTKRPSQEDYKMLREFCEQEGELVTYYKGDQLEREGDPARWFAFVTEGCFKYVTRGISDDKEHITWFSFDGEFVGDYPAALYGSPAQNTIEAMMPSRVFRVTGEQFVNWFRESSDRMERVVIGWSCAASSVNYSLVRLKIVISTTIVPRLASVTSCS